MLRSLVEYFRPVDRFSRLLSDTPEAWRAVDAESASEETLDTLVRLSNWGLVNLRFYLEAPHLRHQASGHGQYWNLTVANAFCQIAAVGHCEMRLIAAQRTMLGNRAMGGIEPFKVNVEPRWKWEPVTWAKAAVAGNVAIAQSNASIGDINTTIVNQPPPIDFRPTIVVQMAAPSAEQPPPVETPKKTPAKGAPRAVGEDIDPAILAHLVKHHEYDPELPARVRNFTPIVQITACSELKIKPATMSTKLNKWFKPTYAEACSSKKIGFQLQNILDEGIERNHLRGDE